MRDNNTIQYNSLHNSSNLKNQFGYTQPTSFIRSPQHKPFINNPFGEKSHNFYQQQPNRNFNPIRPGNEQLVINRKDQTNFNGVTNPLNRRTTVDHFTQLRQPNGYFIQQRQDETQKQSDLRGTCPNIFKKIEQTGIRNTMLPNNSIKTNIQQQFQKKAQPSNILQNNPQLSFIKHNEKSNIYIGNVNSQVSTSLVLQNQDKIKGEGTKSTIQSVKSEQKMKNITHYTSLNQIIFNKDMKKEQQKNPNNPQKSKIIGGFEVGKMLGKGKFGQVYLGRHQKTGFIVALKRIVKAKIKQYKMLDQLKEEIKLHSALIHPNIVRFYGFFEETEDIYLVLQYMNGGTLFDYLAEKQRLNIKEAVDFLRDTIQAVQHLHEISVAHRDIKPQNIVLSTEGVAKLCDFGWSALVESSRKTYCGTFDYAPPQILERKNYDASIDIWCIGVLTYELLTGKVPFEGDGRNIVMNKIINVDKQKINYPPEIPSSAREFIESLVRKNPSERPKCKDLLTYKLFTQNPRKTKKNDNK